MNNRFRQNKKSESKISFENDGKKCMKHRGNLYDLAALFLPIGMIYGLMHLFGITCPIKYLTGISCAGCGMTRASLALIHGDIHKAAYYHPLVFMIPAVLLLFLYRKHMTQKTQKVLLTVGMILFIIVYIQRMADPSNEIVVFSPKSGLIFRLLRLWK